MTTMMQYTFLSVFIPIFFYLFLRILINTKFNKLDVVKELYLIGLVSSVLFIVSFAIFTPDVINFPTKMNLTPFKVISTLIKEGNLNLIFSCILGGILLYIPLGFFAYYCFEGNGRDTLLMCFLITLVIEGVQLLQPNRISNIDDVFLNIIGGFVGLLLSYKFVKKTQLRF